MTGLAGIIDMEQMTGSQTMEITDDLRFIDSVLKDMEYYVSYLEDAPDGALMPFGGRLIGIGERLVRLEECLLKYNNRV